MNKHKKLNLTHYIFIGLILGIAIGYYFNVTSPTVEAQKEVADNFSIISEVFLRLIKLIVSPLVLSSLIVGIAKMGDINSVGRIGIKTLSLFMLASLISLGLGLIMVNVLRPGDAMISMVSNGLSGEIAVQASTMTFKSFVLHTFPESIIDSMARNEILQVVVFSLFFATGLSALGKAGEPLIEVLDIVFHTMLKVTGYVMRMAPLAVFAAVASAITQHGMAILGTYGKFMGEFYFTVFVLWITLIFLGWLVLRSPIFKLLSNVKAAILLAFTTSSSEAAYPKILETLEDFGVPNKTASFILPIGYSFNLTGSMIYCTFATMFIAQAYQIHLSLAEQLTMLGMLMLTSKGMAGVPRASLVVIAATLIHFNIPQEGLLLLLAVDHFLDMARSATNVVGNTISCAIVAKWEKEI